MALSIILATANTPPTIALVLVKKCRNDDLDSMYSTAMGENSYEKITPGKLI
jgi:hypothetical protein